MSARLEELHRRRPRSRLLQVSLGLLLALVSYSWLSGDLDVRGLFEERRLDNLRRFLTQEIVPASLRGRGFDPEALFDWAVRIMNEHGTAAALATLAIATLAITLAGLLSFVLAPLAASSVASARPFLGSGPDAGAGRAASSGWRILRTGTRAAMILMRSVPEYILAFLLLAILGPTQAWPAVLALALHNGGILGRLGAETIENLDPGPLRTLSAIGARRRGVLFAGVFPLALGRYLLYFFYRFETCVREATVLGMLGVVSLGYWIQEARARLYYDEMLLLVAVGAGIVLLADLASALARRFLRRGV